MKQILLTPCHVKDVLEVFFFVFFVASTCSIVSDSIAAVKKHRGIPFNFVQFYEMHTNDIIMVNWQQCTHADQKYKDMYKRELYTLKVCSD